MAAKSNLFNRIKSIKKADESIGIDKRLMNLKRADELGGIDERLKEIKESEAARPAFSIVVITYEPVWEKLRATLASILSQDFKDYEIILTDDGSKVNHFDKVEKYFKHFEFTRYKFITHAENRGTVKNLISGVGAAEGKYIRDFGPGDLFYSRDTLGKVYNYMTETECKIAAGLPIGYTKTDKGRKSVAFNHPFDIDAYLKNNEERILENLILYSDMVCGANLVYERDFFLHYLNRIEDHVIYAEDLIQIMSAVEGERTSIMPFRMIWYEVDTGSSTKKASPFKKRLAVDVENLYDLLLSEHPDNKLLKKRKKLSKYYKIDNLYLRTALRSFQNPGLYPYMLRHYGQSLTGKHNPKNAK